MRTPLPYLALVALALPGCLEPSHPCDPDAAPDVRRTGVLSGQVVDQRDEPVADVTVVVEGQGRSTTSDGEGRFRLAGLSPNAGEVGYELITFPKEPAMGGRVFAPPLGCEAEVSDVVLRVAVPPDAPEVEIVEATAPDRLFVAFGAVAAGTQAEEGAYEEGSHGHHEDDDGTLEYIVEVRAPFEPWRQAVLAKDPWLSFDEQPAVASQLEAGKAQTKASDEHAREACVFFSYVHASLIADVARCAEVVGLFDADGEPRRLEPLGSYQVRVRADLPIGEALVAQRLPARVLSPPSAVPAGLTLAPTSILPVMLDPDRATHDEKMSRVDIECIVPVGNGRFALLDGDVMSVVGRAEVLSEGAYREAEGAPADTMAYDGSASTEATADVSLEDGRALAMLPAGRWVRVWKRRVSALGETSSQVDKVFIGSETHDEAHAPAGPQPGFPHDLDAAGLTSQLRSFSWLAQPEGRLSGPYNPPDGYLLLFPQGFAMLEREGVLTGADRLLSAFDDGLEDGSVNTWAGADESGRSAMTTGVCADLGAAAVGIDGEEGERSSRLCLDLAGLRGEDLDLRDVAILREELELFSFDRTHHVLSDAAGDRVLVVPTHALLGRSAMPLNDAMQEVRVGVRPVDLVASKRLDCLAGQEEHAEPVVLVANQGSLDVSVLSVRGEPGYKRVEEVDAVGLPGVPVSFLDDPDGVSCGAPYVWVLAEDGRMFPLDMRRQHFGLPDCGGEDCVVRSRGRVGTGAVSRDVNGVARVLVGGRGMLGEVGYLRPGNAAR